LLPYRAAGSVEPELVEDNFWGKENAKMLWTILVVLLVLWLLGLIGGVGGGLIHLLLVVALVVLLINLLTGRRTV
jgi:fatty acid desaturase